MLNLQEATITQDDKTEPIIHWSVVFKTPFGWFTKLVDAVSCCTERDLDPNLCIVPAPRAHSNTMNEVL